MTPDQAKRLQTNVGVATDGDIGPVTLAALFVRMGARVPADQFGRAAAECFPAAGLLDSPLRLAHAMAQFAHESGRFRQLVELWGPTDAQRRYDGRLGNTHPGDGYLYRGRGIIQLTGRANYRDCGRAIGEPLEDAPVLAADPAIAVKSACWFWSTHNLNAAADRDDLEAVTRAINGGRNGLADRLIRLTIAKGIVGI